MMARARARSPRPLLAGPEGEQYRRRPSQGPFSLLAPDHAHSKNALHRDLKPANGFLSKNLRCVKIGDFGIANALEHTDLAVTRVGLALMSP